MPEFLSFASLVKCLRIRAGAYLRVEYLKAKFVER
jgi:hypothetical protein